MCKHQSSEVSSQGFFSLDYFQWLHRKSSALKNTTKPNKKTPQHPTTNKQTPQNTHQPSSTQKTPKPTKKQHKKKKNTKKKVSSLLWTVNTALLPCPKWEGNCFWKLFQNWLYLRPPPLCTHPQTHSLARECKWMSEKLRMQTLAGILPLLCYKNQAWKTPRTSSTRGLCQILLPYPPRKTTKPQLLASDMPIPPSMMLQTWGQMANSNVYFCASFQTALARPDGILCLPGIN